MATNPIAAPAVHRLITNAEYTLQALALRRRGPGPPQAGLGATRHAQPQASMAGRPPPRHARGIKQTDLWATEIAYAIMFGYYAGFEATLGRTPAKFLTGTKVVGADGGHPSVAQILGRTLARFVPFEPLSFFGRAGWHDRWSGTRVVYTRVGAESELAPGVVCGVCNEEFQFGRSSCPRCEAEYRYVAGQPELRQD